MISGDSLSWMTPSVKVDPTLRYVRHRPVFVAGPAGSKISPNLAGRLAADFAECYQVFRETQPHVANKCLVSAEHIFDLADVWRSGDLLTTAPFDFYGETEWRDDMELGATELYFALTDADGLLPSGIVHSDPMFYLRAAGHWAHAYITGPNDAADTLNLYDVSGDVTVNAHLAVTLYWGYAQGKSVVEAIYPRGKDGHLGYVEVTYKF